MDNWTASPQNVFRKALSVSESVQMDWDLQFFQCLACCLSAVHLQKWTIGQQALKIFSAQHYPSPNSVEMDLHTKLIPCLPCCLSEGHLQKWTIGQQALKMFSHNTIHQEKTYKRTSTNNTFPTFLAAIPQSTYN